MAEGEARASEDAMELDSPNDRSSRTAEAAPQPRKDSISIQNHNPAKPPFPPHNAPRVWFMTALTAPIAIGLARLVLAHGDYVVGGVIPSEFAGERGEELRAFLDEVRVQGVGGGRKRSGSGVGSPESSEKEGGGSTESSGDGKKTGAKRWQDRVRVVAMDGRIIGQCQAAVAEAVEAFGGVDILLGCTSECVIGSVEELAQSNRTQSLMREQFETNFFSNVNVIKAALPSMRRKSNGHIIMLTGITGHLGTPGLGAYCASQWAIEGYCDSLAYEIAPFNIKMTIVQPNLEINVLSNKITSAPPLSSYSPDTNPAPLCRDIIGGLLDKLCDSVGYHPHSHEPKGTSQLQTEEQSSAEHDAQNLDNLNEPTTGNVPDGADHDAEDDNMDDASEDDQAAHLSSFLSSPHTESIFPPLPTTLRQALIAETCFAIAAIGGHDNPPARHIVGFEGIAAVREKLKTVSEELEDFIDVSCAADLTAGGDTETY
ncbi:NAD(P)-binding protein [Eremomyces bilateralis CBS 781.70]|uniref:NAD(P)-binding protein n=1 Tax=Eremomyces bilateralis CBS 781.70 TaxID=1392243 RepID=A0A6G1FWU9_9PEZI|nr:NAD(P)-binding protein [Eremomyces bilateralis CBS 781.70]KAF1810263.1 NAD(P)-binding protein [Eremomyces bilateralis CBS 781.70]